MRYQYKFAIVIYSIMYSLSLASTDITGAFDSRLELTEFSEWHYMLHGAELNIKYTYADARGDRLMGFLQIPYSPHWKSERFLYHYGDAYLIVKGDLEEPSIRVGRFDIPFGLLKTFDSHFSLAPQLFEKSLALKKDIGASFSGYYKILTYDLSFTQGYNSFSNPRNDMPITIRLGLDNEEIKAGVSYYNSTHAMSTMPKMRRIGIDFEKNINPFVIRGEGIIGDNPVGKGFSVMIDFPIFWSIQGTGSGLYWREDNSYQAYGLELKKEISFLTIGVGLIHEKEAESKTQVILQTIIKI